MEGRLTLDSGAKFKTASYLGETADEAKRRRVLLIRLSGRPVLHVASSALSRNDRAHRPQSGQGLPDNWPRYAEPVSKYRLRWQAAPFRELPTLNQANNA